MKKLILVLSLIVVAVVGVTLFMYDMGIDNKEMALRERFKGQDKICMTSYDNMYKVISQDAQVTDKYASDFKDIFAQISDNLMGDEAMLKVVAGFNPQLDPSAYKELMTTIKTERAKFKRAQDICIDVSRAYATYIKTKPQTWFINDEILEAKELIKYGYEKDLVMESKEYEPETKEAWTILTFKPVTSKKTKNVFETGEENDIDLGFNKSSDADKTSEVVEKSDDTKSVKEKLKDADLTPEQVLAIDNALKTK